MNGVLIEMVGATLVWFLIGLGIGLLRREQDVPYKMQKLAGGKARVVEGASGDRPGHKFSKKPQSKAKAEAQMRLLQGVAHGWKPTGKPAKHERAATPVSQPLVTGAARQATELQHSRYARTPQAVPPGSGFGGGMNAAQAAAAAKSAR
jgi:hypothetical protein